MTLTGAALGLTVIAAAAGGYEKLRVLAQGRTTWHPVILAWPALRRNTKVLFMATGLIDISLAAAIYFQSPVRPWAIAAWVLVLLIYTTLGYRAVSDTGACGCFGQTFEVRTQSMFLTRNALLVLIAGSLVLTDPAGQITSIASGASLIVLYALARRVLRKPVRLLRRGISVGDSPELDEGVARIAK